METETPSTTPDLKHSEDGKVVIAANGDRIILATAGDSMAMTRGELQAMVQVAYDRHGITAQLWTDGTEPEPGRCRCGMDGCSDGPAKAGALYVGEYRDAMFRPAL